MVNTIFLTCIIMCECMCVCMCVRAYTAACRWASRLTGSLKCSKTLNIHFGSRHRAVGLCSCTQKQSSFWRQLQLVGQYGYGTTQSYNRRQLYPPTWLWEAAAPKQAVQGGRAAAAHRHAAEAESGSNCSGALSAQGQQLFTGSNANGQRVLMRSERSWTATAHRH